MRVLHSVFSGRERERERNRECVYGSEMVENAV